MHIDEMLATARELMADHKGLLAMDETIPNIHRRFEAAGIAQSTENRRAYRELIVTTPEIGRYLSGAILIEETLGQATEQGTLFPDILLGKGIMPGIKVDEGTADLSGFPGEKITIGLDHLRERLKVYRAMGLKFAKWRAVFKVGRYAPTGGAIVANTHELARYAALCQEASLVPIVEPEVLMEGDHDIHRAAAITKHVLIELFNQLNMQQVHLRCMILKPNMVVPGFGAPLQASSTEVAHATVDCLMETVPAAVPGIAFLSGGQSPQEATDRLNAIHYEYPTLPWPVTFSYSRAIQQPALTRWMGKKENIGAAQALLVQRLRLLMLARHGVYRLSMEEANKQPNQL